MNSLFFIRLPHDASASVSWLRASEAGAALGDVTSGTLEQAAAEALHHPDTQVVVLVPASEVVFARAAAHEQHATAAHAKPADEVHPLNTKQRSWFAWAK